MRRVLLVVVLIVAAAVLGLWRTNGGVRQGLSKAIGMSSDDSQGDARDEIRKSFQLQPSARIEVRDINGSVEVQTSDTKTAGVYVLPTCNSRGARLSGVNGNIELRLSKDLNADLTARGMNGNLRSDIPEVNVEKEEHGSRYAAHIGNGGAPITISGINGNVRLMRPESSATGAASTDQKSANST